MSELLKAAEGVEKFLRVFKDAELISEALREVGTLEARKESAQKNLEVLIAKTEEKQKEHDYLQEKIFSDREKAEEELAELKATKEAEAIGIVTRAQADVKAALDEKDQQIAVGDEAVKKLDGILKARVEDINAANEELKAIRDEIEKQKSALTGALSNLGVSANGDV
ncbi:MAG: hypothetical protein IT558_00715 [Alphaproteobacteria bacterium]|nr:hypothetical protein [Alphaproteobacteria bacterium]